EHQRVAPRLVAPADRGQVLAVCHRKVVGDGDDQPADGRRGLRVAKHGLSSLRVREKLREPRDGCHELDADGEHGRATKGEQRGERRTVSGGECRETVEQYAPSEDAAASEAVCEVATEQTEDAADGEGEEEEQPDP